MRNAVVKIRRLSKVDQWLHVTSEHNAADLATRRTTLDQISTGSQWQTGMDWMQKQRQDWPVKTITELTVASGDKRLSTLDDVHLIFTGSMKEKVSDRY